MKPTRDDLELTLRELRSQRMQHTINLMIVDAAIVRIEKELKACPPKVEVKDERKERPTGVY